MARIREIDFSVGGFHDGYTRVWVKDDGRELKAFAKELAGEMEPMEPIFSGELRKVWLDTFELLGVESWENEYVEPYVLDGTQWELLCVWDDGRTKKVEGSNAYPEQWDGLIMMLSAFVDDLDKYKQEEETEEEYLYVSAVFKGSEKEYNYLAPDELAEELEEGAFCLVPTGPENTETVGMITDFGYYSEEDAPYPPERTKEIIKLVEPPADAELYGREYEEEYDDDDEDDDFGAPQDVAGAAKELAHDLMEITRLLKDEDYEEAFKWALKHQYDRRQGIAAKVVRALESYINAKLDTEGEAALTLGALYYAGIIVPRDYGKAVGCYAQASEEGGNVRAMGNLGYCYYYGRAVEQSYETAYHFFNQGVLLGNDANCLYKLGDMYMNGYFVERDETMAFRLYTRAKDVCMESEEGGGEFWPDVALRLGRSFLEGTGTEKNLDFAHSLLSIAVNGFYRRRHTDPFVLGLIEKGEKLRDEAARKLKQEIAAVAEQ